MGHRAKPAKAPKLPPNNLLIIHFTRSNPTNPPRDPPVPAGELFQCEGRKKVASIERIRILIFLSLVDHCAEFF